MPTVAETRRVLRDLFMRELSWVEALAVDPTAASRHRAWAQRLLRRYAVPIAREKARRRRAARMAARGTP